MTRLYLIRHGETDAGREGRSQGHSGVALNENGRRQARDLAQALASAGVKPEVLYSSDLPRARQTAELLAASLSGLSVIPDPRLRERDPGLLAGLTISEMRERWPDWWAANERDPGSTRPPSGESFEDLKARLLVAVQEAVTAHPGGEIGLVTHGGPIKVLVCHTLGVPLNSVDRLVLDNCRVTVVEWGANPRLVAFNSHPGPWNG